MSVVRGEEEFKPIVEETNTNYTFSSYYKRNNVVRVKAPWWRFWNKTPDVHTEQRWERIVVPLNSEEEYEAFRKIYMNLLNALSSDGGMWGSTLEMHPKNSTQYIKTKENNTHG